MKIERCKRRNEKKVIADSPPCFIIVTLFYKNRNMRSSSDFPLSFDLLECCNNGIAIPISMNQIVDLEICKKEKTFIKYYDHALDLGFAFVAWKVQGLAFECVIICIYGEKCWTFENLCLAFSRVKTNEGIRCLPLTKAFNLSTLKNKLPSIWTTR